MLNKKGEMGVGTLIIFIAMLLVAAVAAGVLIQTAGSLQEKSLSTGQQARSQISTNARVIEISATDGQNGNLTDFRQIVKLSPGSDAIKLNQIIFSVNTKDRTSTLKYRGTDGICIKNNSIGYNTWNEIEFDELEVWNNNSLPTGIGNVFIGPGVNANPDQQDKRIGIDLDDDGADDYVRTCDGTGTFCPIAYDGYLQFTLSTDGIIYVQLQNDNNSYPDITSNPGDGFYFTNLKIGNYGYMKGWRTAGSGPDFITDVDPGIYLEIFENPQRLEEDYDDDNLDDYFAVNNTHALLILGSGTTLSIPLGIDLNDACQTINLNSEAFQDVNQTYASLTIQSACAGSKIIPLSDQVELTPYEYGKGYFSVIYETQGTNHVAGNLQRGDIIRLCYEAPGIIGEDSMVRLNFIPKIGTPTLTEFVTPDVISTERVYLYP